MKRNWYALLILAVLAGFLTGAGYYVDASASLLQRQIGQAYACTQMQDYDAARTAFRAAARTGQTSGRWLVLLIRRNLVDQLNQTLAVLPGYANPDNQADLEVEVSRVCAQISQLKQSFFGFG